MSNIDSLEARGFLTETEAAPYLGFEPATLRIWRMKGKGPRYFKLGGRIAYKRQDLDEWIERQAREPGCEMEAA
jgi:predicted DNA-binding transcriptional regulator AlpA